MVDRDIVLQMLHSVDLVPILDLDDNAELRSVSVNAEWTLPTSFGVNLDLRVRSISYLNIYIVGITALYRYWY